MLDDKKEFCGSGSETVNEVNETEVGLMNQTPTEYKPADDLPFMVG